MKYKLKRLYDLFRYDIPRFVKNVWIYRKALWNSYQFDYSGALHYLKIHLEQLEPCIRNGYHVRGDKTADRVKTCRLLLERILEDSSQYDLYNYDLNMKDWPRSDSGHRYFEFISTPKGTEHPRENTKVFREIMKNKESQDWKLLFKLLEKHLNRFWD